MANADELKGRAKEAAGALTKDRNLKREGKADRTSGKIKSAVDEATDRVKEVLRKR